MISQGICMAKALSMGFLGKQIDGIWHTGLVVFRPILRIRLNTITAVEFKPRVQREEKAWPAGQPQQVIEFETARIRC
jgi:hypothetical protein